MQTQNFTVEYSVRFTSNKGNFNHQPVFNMINNGGLTGDDFLRVVIQPRDFIVGAFSQIIILPIIAFLLI